MSSSPVEPVASASVPGQTRRRHLDRWYPESRFGGYSDADGTIAFYTRVRSLLQPQTVVVDVGCGRGAFRDDPVPFRRELRTLKGHCRMVIGLDLDPDAAENPYLDEFRRLPAGGSFPLDDASADLIVSDSVVEHIQDPGFFFDECARILRPGGIICIRTPNALSYLGLVARVVPNRLHARILTRVQERRKAKDVFPTVYRCNSVWSLRRYLRASGFDPVVYTHEAEPSYFAFSRLAYALGVAHQRYAPRLLRLTLFAFAQKQPT